MDSSETEPLSNSEKKEETAPSTSDQGQDGAKPKKASLKRTAAKPKNAKSKKRKKARVSQPGYRVEQGEDMLFVISSTTSQYDYSAWKPPKKGSKKKKPSKAKIKAGQSKKKRTVRAKPKPAIPAIEKEKEDSTLFVPQEATDNRWGESVPEEVLINIFQMVVSQDGAVPFLCRVGRVCRLWNAAASSPVLWRKTTISHCWIAPGKSQLPKTETRIKETFTWLSQNRFSQLRDFSLYHWKKNVNFAVETLSQNAPHLHSLTLSYCAGLTAGAFQSLGLHGRSLQSINLQYSEFQVEGLLEYLENHGSQIKQFLYTHEIKHGRVIAAITRGVCPDLEFLEVNTKLDNKDCELHINIQALQVACPKLKTFRMLNVRPLLKTARNDADSTLGFPLLEELCIATTSYSYMTDKDLWDILFGSTKLRVLDLRGCSRVTPSGLAGLPCAELECLYWGQYFSSTIGSSSTKKGLHMVTEKWSRTLQQLDIANQLFTEEELEIAMSYFGQATEADTLRSLNLSGTRITPTALRSVIGQMTSLNYLNLSACRYLPRGLKRIYRGQEDIHQLLDKLD
ncbi:F-box/LRR-repeat protein 6 [Cheilinus undulatus]|uniref:F-box/LRR-repeat protein 6 n=1 Tax=Cheilinus undulatus TaxID=241271 RepID=UPI001BD5FC15|nr:F-box/LRR-repeat protein 6 [Cheilinus undulatus]XP_041664101.1 F-box/LRR-repeat protein 6 [Cheilinus undulatus]XP_041664102.1 F-box/LRR-repeat protein 6 [Cheilinus undulatus]